MQLVSCCYYRCCCLAPGLEPGDIASAAYTVATAEFTVHKYAMAALPVAAACVDSAIFCVDGDAEACLQVHAV